MVLTNILIRACTYLKASMRTIPVQNSIMSMLLKLKIIISRINKINLFGISKLINNEVIKWNAMFSAVSEIIKKYECKS